MLSIVRGIEATTIDQVHQSLYNADLVHEALTGDPNEEVRDAAKVINPEKVLDSGPAPIVAIISHPTSSQSAIDDVTLQARIADKGKGIGRIEWPVNGVTAAVASAPSVHGSEYTVTQRLAIDPGNNIIEVVAYNGTNLLALLAARTTIKFTGPAQANPKPHILAIGIHVSSDKGWAPPGKGLALFPPLKLAVKDATTFGADMKRATGTLDDEVRVTPALTTHARPVLSARTGCRTGLPTASRPRRPSFYLIPASQVRGSLVTPVRAWMHWTLRPLPRLP